MSRRLRPSRHLLPLGLAVLERRLLPGGTAKIETMRTAAVCLRNQFPKPSKGRSKWAGSEQRPVWWPALELLHGIPAKGDTFRLSRPISHMTCFSLAAWLRGCFPEGSADCAGQISTGRRAGPSLKRPERFRRPDSSSRLQCCQITNLHGIT